MAQPINPALGGHLLAYSGVPTFMRQTPTRDLSGADVAIVGVPFDSGATSFRGGTRFGPRKIREASLALWGHHYIHGVAPAEALNIVDYGDVAVEMAYIEKTMSSITAEVGAALAAGPMVVALGGDHSISLPLLRAQAANARNAGHGPLALVHFDAHTDVEPGDYEHGTVFRHAVEEGLIDPAAFIQVGIRGSLYFPDDLNVARRLGIRVLTIDDCFEMGIPAVIAAIRETVGDRRTYVTLDIDAADPAFAPGTGTPEPGGFSSYQMLQLMRGLKGLNLVGMDIVEVSPPYDHADVTAILAANLVFEYLCLVALNRA
ncbi:MAG: agmatinase [Candidatus Promineofilum sp.]|nr:agmatinase [Promineifilum sp.]